MGQSCKRRTNARHREQGRRQSRDISGQRQRAWYIISHIKVHGRVAYLATQQLGNNSLAPSRHCGTGAATSHLDWACVVFGVIWKEPWALGHATRSSTLPLQCHYTPNTLRCVYSKVPPWSLHGPSIVPDVVPHALDAYRTYLSRLLRGMYSVSR